MNMLQSPSAIPSGERPRGVVKGPAALEPCTKPNVLMVASMTRTMSLKKALFLDETASTPLLSALPLISARRIANRPMGGGILGNLRQCHYGTGNTIMVW